MENWNEISIGKWEHATKPGVNLICENDFWKLVLNGKTHIQVRSPSDPFAWANRVIADTPRFWD